MSGALKFVKVIVALRRCPAALYGSPHINSSLCVAAQDRGRPAAGSWTTSTDFGRGQIRPSARSLEPGPDTARADETADPPHLQINPAGGRDRAFVALQGEVVRRPFVLVGGITDAEIEVIEIPRDR